MALVALDVGQSGVRALARMAAGERRATSEGVAEPLATHGAPERVATRLAPLVAQVADGPIDVLAVGLSGIDRIGDQTVAVGHELARLTGARSVRVASDVVTWHLAVFRGRAGVVGAVGTGSVALAADGAGRCARADGWGHLLGDGASGFTVGRAGLASALAAFDGRGGSEDLLARASARFGEGPAIAAAVHGSSSPVATVAAFAPDVLASAEAGDLIAAGIWNDAGRSLAAMLLAAWRAVFIDGPPVPVAVTGSLAAAGERLLEPCRLLLAEHGLRPERHEVDPLDGVVHLGLLGADAYPGLAVDLQGGA